MLMPIPAEIGEVLRQRQDLGVVPVN